MMKKIVPLLFGVSLYLFNCLAYADVIIRNPSRASHPNADITVLVRATINGASERPWLSTSSGRDLVEYGKRASFSVHAFPGQTINSVRIFGYNLLGKELTVYNNSVSDGQIILCSKQLEYFFFKWHLILEKCHLQ